MNTKKPLADSTADLKKTNGKKLRRADLNESGIEEGISQAEFDAALTWLRTNQKKHKLEENDIALLEDYFSEHLQD